MKLLNTGLAKYLAVALLIMTAGNAPASRIPSDMPQSRRVETDLGTLQSDAVKLDHELAELQSTVRSAKSSVGDAINAARAIRSMDDRLKKLVDQLKPYHSIPKVRTFARTLSKNLQRIQTQLHALRKKSDECEKQVLKPLKRKLSDLDQGITSSRIKVRTYRANVQSWRTELVALAMESRRIPGASNLFDRSVGSVSGPIHNVTSKLHEASRRCTAMVHRVNQFASIMKAYDQFERSLNEFEKKLKPAETTVGKLDRTLGKQLSIKVPFSKKTLRFSIREILEKPGEILGVVLKPLELLADKALQPILKKMNLEIKPPAGLEELSRQLDRANSLQRAIDQSVQTAADSLASEWNRLGSRWPELRRQLSTLKSHQNRRIANEAPRSPSRQTRPESRKLPAMFVQIQ
ncbi:hypothetical protein [Rhodopirellula sp. MGV]|uniref:hypothetical protein n=1 Tax=Rhodopirellula sp. MGV TaxID=2023130 RepID=UPI000B96D3F8|nr:hypothetical protein [Rhodopirellula sp. MGV]OYP35822.1 hypothetical protein CGZ80_10520 [Rhodopirellula sp. MGV]PNY36365.1 hypothetical protein C2E31_13090 [Rhodopirellula baltica]